MVKLTPPLLILCCAIGTRKWQVQRHHHRVAAMAKPQHAGPLRHQCQLVRLLVHPLATMRDVERPIQHDIHHLLCPRRARRLLLTRVCISCHFALAAIHNVGRRSDQDGLARSRQTKEKVLLTILISTASVFVAMSLLGIASTACRMMAASSSADLSACT